MKINLWFSEPTQHWRWTLTSDLETCMMESGNSKDLDTAMKDVANTVKWLLDSQSNHFSHD